MALLSKAEIVAAEDGLYDTMTAWGGEIRVRSLTGAQRGELVKEGEKAKSWDALVCIMGIVDEKGVPMFALAEIDQLARKHPDTLGRVARRILELSGLGEEAQDAIDTNFLTTQTSSGGTSSPDTTGQSTAESTTGQT